MRAHYMLAVVLLAGCSHAVPVSYSAGRELFTMCVEGKPGKDLGKLQTERLDVDARRFAKHEVEMLECAASDAKRQVVLQGQTTRVRKPSYCCLYRDTGAPLPRVTPETRD